MEIAVVDAIIVAAIGAFVVGAIRFLQRSVRRELQAVIKETVNPELEKLNQRIDDHMDREEEEMRRLIRVLAKLSGEDPVELDKEITP